MKRFLLLPALLIPVFLCSCASLITGQHDQVSFGSNPDGATVTVGGKPIGKTPVTINLKKESGQTLTFEKDGFKPQSMELGTRINPWFWGNILFGGLVGSTTDSLAGAVYEYRPNQYMVTLEPTTVTMPIQRATEKTNDQKIKEFIVMGYRPLLDDLKAGHGEYVSSLLDLLNIPQESRVDTTKKLLALSAVYTSIPEFAERVNDLARSPGDSPEESKMIKALPGSSGKEEKK